MIKFAHIWFKHSLHVRAVDNYDEGVKDEFEILRHTVLLLLLLLSMFIGKSKQITLLFNNVSKQDTTVPSWSRGSK